MKRIANEVALQTVLYVIGGLQKIRVIDYKNEHEAQTRGDHTEIFNGLYKDRKYDTFNYKQEHAAVRSIEPDGDELVIGICTMTDKYKY